VSDSLFNSVLTLGVVGLGSVGLHLLGRGLPYDLGVGGVLSYVIMNCCPHRLNISRTLTSSDVAAELFFVLFRVFGL